MFLLFDAANTLIHKPGLYPAIEGILIDRGYSIPSHTLAERHKWLSEQIIFPDRTDKEFYAHFNSELLLSLGILPNPNLLNSIYQACTGLRWETFSDVDALLKINLPMGVLSNFHSGLHAILPNQLKDLLKLTMVSETQGLRKPDLAFYQFAIDNSGYKPHEILYVGDSVRLDLQPAIQMGINAWLIDRDGHYLACPRRISSLSELQNLIG